MIEVKLSFPNQAALLAFFAGAAGVAASEKAAVSAITAPKPAPTPAATVVAPAASTTPAAESHSDPKPAASATPAASTASSQKPDASAGAGAADPIDYADVSKAITDMVKSNRAHAVAVLAQFGCKKGTELKAEQYADFLKALG